MTVSGIKREREREGGRERDRKKERERVRERNRKKEIRRLSDWGRGEGRKEGEEVETAATALTDFKHGDGWDEIERKMERCTQERKNSWEEKGKNVKKRMLKNEIGQIRREWDGNIEKKEKKQKTRRIVERKDVK